MNTNNPNPFQSTIDQIAALGDQKKQIEKALKRYLSDVEKRVEKEKAQINEIIELLNNSTASTQKKPSKKEKPKKLSDEEILSQVKEILSNGVKLSKSAVQDKLGIAYPRFTSFIKSHADLFGYEGVKKTSVIFLK
jgi:hypothetical protein